MTTLRENWVMSLGELMDDRYMYVHVHVYMETLPFQQKPPVESHVVYVYGKAGLSMIK
jgi:hypothetical protein